MSAMIEEKVITKELDVKLTHIEMAEKAKAAGDLQAEIGLENQKFNTKKKDHIASVSKLQERLWNILNVCSKGKETRTVECTERRNFSACSVEYIYGGDVVETRAMEDGEFQKDMFTKEEKKFSKADSVDAEVESVEESESKSVDEQIAEDIRESTRTSTASSAVL